MEQSREKSSALLYTSANEKGAFESPSITVTNLLVNTVESGFHAR